MGFCKKIQQHALLVENDAVTQEDFIPEMGRFLPLDVAERTVSQAAFWPYLSGVINEEVQQLNRLLNQQESSAHPL